MLVSPSRKVSHLLFTTPNIAELIAKHRVRCFLFKCDLCRAYHQFPVSPLDYPLLEYLWEDKLYFDTTLPMGPHFLAMMCQHITSAVCYICEQSGHDILNYIADFMGVAPQTQAWNSYQFLGRHLSWLGLRELTTRAITSSIVVTCLEVQFETINMTVYMALFRLFIAELVSLEILHQIGTVITHRKAYVCGQVCSSVIFLILAFWTSPLYQVSYISCLLDL